MQQEIFDRSSVENIPLEVVGEEDLTAAEQRQLKASGLGMYPFEAWDIAASSAALGYSTHNLFRFYGKFPPPVAAHLIETYCPDGGRILDPMCGSGTSGVEAQLRGRVPYLNDVNPLCRLISAAKTTYIDPDECRRALGHVYQAYEPRTADEYPLTPIGLRDPDHWFLDETQDSLRGIHKAITDTDCSDSVTDFLRAVFAATVRPVSRATTDQGRLFLDRDSARRDALKTFKARAERALSGVSSLSPEMPESSTTSTKATQLDADMLSVDSGFDLAIVHPPYFTNYRFSRITSLELAWMGWDHAKVRNDEVREFFKMADPNRLDEYINDVVEVLLHVKEMLHEGGTLALMIGDTKIRSSYIQVVRPVLETIEQSGLLIEKIALRRPRFTEASWAASQRRTGEDVGVSLADFVAILRTK